MLRFSTSQNLNSLASGIQVCARALCVATDRSPEANPSMLKMPTGARVKELQISQQELSGSLSLSLAWRVATSSVPNLRGSYSIIIVAIVESITKSYGYVMLADSIR